MYALSLVLFGMWLCKTFFSGPSDSAEQGVDRDSVIFWNRIFNPEPVVKTTKPVDVLAVTSGHREAEFTE